MSGLAVEGKKWQSVDKCLRAEHITRWYIYHRKETAEMFHKGKYVDFFKHS